MEKPRKLTKKDIGKVFWFENKFHYGKLIKFSENGSALFEQNETTDKFMTTDDLVTMFNNKWFIEKTD